MPIALNTIITGDAKPATKSGRKPLQPKNIFLSTDNVTTRIPNVQTAEKVSVAFESKKENRPVHEAPTLIQPFDASLAEELCAIRKKTERLRLDRERTEEMLKERDRAMELQIKEVLERGEIQKILEIEVDRLFRLKEIHSSSMKVSPIRSLREKMNRNASVRSLELRTEDTEESEGENTVQSPSSASSQHTASVPSNCVSNL